MESYDATSIYVADYSGAMNMDDIPVRLWALKTALKPRHFYSSERASLTYE